MRYRAAITSDRLLKENRLKPDGGPEERWQHSGRLYQVTSRAGVMAVRASEECVIDVLLFQGHITESQRIAAMRLRNDFVEADMTPHLTSSYSSVRVSSSYFARLERFTDG